MNVFKKFCYIYVSTLFLSGCVRFLPEAPVASKKIVLMPQDVQTVAGKKVADALIIEQPLMLASLDSARLKIVLQEETGIALSDVIAGVEWSDKLSSVFQEALIKAFARAEKFSAVGRVEENFYAPYHLQLFVTNFEVVKQVDTSLRVVLGFSVKLIQFQRQTLIGQKQFFWTVDVEEEGVKGIVKAFEKAVSIAGREALEWTLEKIVSAKEGKA